MPPTRPASHPVVLKPASFNLNQGGGPLYNSRVSIPSVALRWETAPASALLLSRLISVAVCFPTGSTPILKGTPLACPLPAIGSRTSLMSFAIHAM
ncbi:hypothetical protein Sinac_2672 [Singulisphaera acidiphila DSM 18658]|uniref:Uncharacterized protein n=1 Tax=Singulisphaera acidiphila (strain ATCC BAA-1392 / DSM 18658 / VKM B-2454 / MOB10) TaxID=886293 RepID=L0DDS1_SINAD|nr:hypothetical protein Sinac_2672 [Singulisphaera acidiphila DSM 18658]